MRLLDDQLAAGVSGMASLRYSIERVPEVYAAHTGRVLELMKRYREMIPCPIELEGYARVKRETEELTYHVEYVALPDPADPWGRLGFRYLRWRQGAGIQQDGAGLPYNQQNAWAAGVCYGSSPGEAHCSYAGVAYDIVSLFESSEAPPPENPVRYEWRYTWGGGRTGWGEDDRVSTNTPVYTGHSGIADISYRTMDARACLVVGRLFPALLSHELVQYFAACLENDAIYLFSLEELHALAPEIRLREENVLKYARAITPWELQNAVWACQVLGEAT